MAAPGSPVVGAQSDFDNLSIWESAEIVEKERAEIEVTRKDFTNKDNTTNGKSSKKEKKEKKGTITNRSSSKRPTIVPTLSASFGSVRSKDKPTVLSIHRSTMEKGEYTWKSLDKIGHSSTVPPESFPLWIIAEPNNNFCESLYSYFYDISRVRLTHKDFISLYNDGQKDFQAIILTGNAFGFKESGNFMHQLVEQFFGEELFEHVRSYIQDQYLGEAPLHTSFIIDTEHDTIKYLVYNCSYLANLDNSYSSLWSSLITIRNHNRAVANGYKKGDPINKFLSTGFKGGEYTESARQMYIAYHNCLAPPIEAPSSYLTSKHDTLTRPIQITPEERKEFLLQQLLKGDLVEKRDWITLEVVDFLLSVFIGDETVPGMDDDSNARLRKNAAKIVARYAFPEETVPGINEMILSKNALHPLLDLVLNGEIQAHVEIDYKEIECGPMIARGASGKIFTGKWRGMEVAIKKFDEGMISFSIEEFRREVAVMSILKHENLIPFYGACTKSMENLHILTKLITNGNLKDLLHSNVELPWHIRVKMGADIASGMAFLHSKGLMHRDLKSLNVLIETDFSVRIIDFGTSRVVDPGSMMTSTIGTVTWMAPEIFNNEKYTEKADVYSFGIMLWELLTRKIPFEELASWNIPVAVTKGERPPIPADANPDYVKLMKACWQAKGSKRPAFSDIYAELMRLYESPENSQVGTAANSNSNNASSSSYETGSPLLTSNSKAKDAEKKTKSIFGIRRK